MTLRMENQCCCLDCKSWSILGVIDTNWILRWHIDSKSQSINGTFIQPLLWICAKASSFWWKVWLRVKQVFAAIGMSIMSSNATFSNEIVTTEINSTMKKLFLVFLPFYFHYLIAVESKTFGPKLYDSRIFELLEYCSSMDCQRSELSKPTGKKM